MRKIISTMALGISWGFTVLVLYMTVSSLVNADFFSNLTSAEFIKNVICSAIVGLGFSVPSLIYRNETLSRWLQVLVHLGIGFVIYISVALYAGWIPTEFGFLPVVISIAVSVVFTLLIWLCFSIYYRKQAEKINKKIFEKQSKNQLPS